MNTVFTILTILVVIAAILLIGVVLLQNGKGEGLASNFVAGNQTFGVRQTADILEKITWGLVAFIRHGHHRPDREQRPRRRAARFPDRSRPAGSTLDAERVIRLRIFLKTVTASATVFSYIAEA